MLIKYNNLKLNKNLKMGYLENDNIKNLIIKKSLNFTIYKELYSGVYILSIPNLLVIQYKYKKNLEDFLLLYVECDNLIFDIYQNGNNYYIICVSKFKEQQFDYKLWLTANDANYKYTLLTSIYDSFFVINKRWYKKNTNVYTYYKSIGNGIVNLEVRNQLKMFIKMINEMKWLPTHFLSM